MTQIKRLKNLLPFLNGLKVEVIRQSRKTGGYTVKLIEPATTGLAYPIGTKLNVAGYNLEDTDGQQQRR